jgi:maleamate amidohydrolase
VSTSGCVRATCVDAMSHGFRTTVIADACGDRHPAPHEANLFDMNAKYADVVSEAEVLVHLQELAASR